MFILTLRKDLCLFTRNFTGLSCSNFVLLQFVNWEYLLLVFLMWIVNVSRLPPSPSQWNFYLHSWRVFPVSEDKDLNALMNVIFRKGPVDCVHWRHSQSLQQDGNFRFHCKTFFFPRGKLVWDWNISWSTKNLNQWTDINTSLNHA
jgi:hypothetical protein